MTIVVNDTNILIDLVELRLLHSFFSLDFWFYTTDLVFDELHDTQKEALQAFIENKKFLVDKIAETQYNGIIALRKERPGLSTQDCSAFYLARYLKQSC